MSNADRIARRDAERAAARVTRPARRATRRRGHTEDGYAARRYVTAARRLAA